MLTKPWGIGTVQHYLTKRALGIHDDTTYNEMMEYTNIDGVEMGPASSSGHDDTVMSYMIALMTIITEEPMNMGEVYGFDETPALQSAGGYDDGEGYRELD